MTRGAAVVAVMLALGCSGADQPPAPTQKPAAGAAAGSATQTGSSAQAPASPPPPRDCSLLAPAIARITAAELADLRANRAPAVLPAAEAELHTAAAVQTAVLPLLCDRDTWSGAYTACVDAAERKADASACSIHLTQTQLDALAAMTREQVAAQLSPGVAECDEWRHVVERLIACDKFPATAKQSMRQALDQTFEAWRQSQGMGRDQIAAACKAAADSTRQSMTSLGCAP
jgi:Tfp pilus assembly protein PilV